jgi:hypothetical protein
LTLVIVSTLSKPITFPFNSSTQLGFQVSSVAKGFEVVVELCFSDKASELISIQVGSLG